MARKKQNFRLTIKRKRFVLIAIVATIAALAWLLSVHRISSQLSGPLGVSSEMLSYYADVIFTFAVSLLLFLLAIAFFSIPFVNYVLIVVAVAVLYHALRKINVL